MIQEKIKFLFFKIVFLNAIFVFCIGGGIFNSFVYADSFDTDSAEVNFTNILDFASGLSGVWDVFDRRETVRNINNQDDNELIVQSVRFPGFTSSEYDVFGQIPEYDDSDIEAEVLGIPLVYPNPFRQSQDSGAQIQYVLSKDLDIEIHFYNMLAYRVFKQSFDAGTIGGRRGINVLEINNESLGGYLLSAGVYFFAFVHDGEVLHKGKMVVKP